MNEIREQLEEAEQLARSSKEDLFEAIEILSKVYFNGMEKWRSSRIASARFHWLKDERRNFLLFPKFILIQSANAMIDGTTVTGAGPGSRYIKSSFYRECNSQVMNVIDDLIEQNAVYELIYWRKIAKDLGLLLTLDKIEEALND